MTRPETIRSARLHKGGGMIWQIIRTGMIRNDIKSIAELAEITGLKSSTLQHERRTNPGSFRLYELKQIADKLNLTNEERRQMI